MNQTHLAPADLRHAQEVMLYIMKRIHTVCVENNIKYWLDYGTLLGAVRHGGFIPWDDDMDIAMMREDYEKFSRIAPQALGDEFFWQTRDSEPEFCFEFGKVILKDTLWIEKNWAKANLKHRGFFVDVFPVDPFPENPEKVKMLDFQTRFYSAVLSYKIAGAASPKLPQRMCQKIAALFLSRKMLTDWFVKTVKKLSAFKEISPLCSTISMDVRQHLCSKHLFDDLILKKFEDTEFFIPAKYDERLQKLFGDYMQPPPEDKRYGHHGIVKIDFGKY